MGEVYLAGDSQLGRQIALKVLPAELTRDAGRVSRFEQEARVISALNHPNIITIHEILRSDDLHCIVTELVEGRPLRQIINQGPLEWRAAVKIAAQRRAECRSCQRHHPPRHQA